MIQFFRPHFGQKYKKIDSYIREKFAKNFKNFQLFSLNLAQILVHKPTIFQCQTLLSPKISSLDPYFSADIPIPFKVKCWGGGQY